MLEKQDAVANLAVKDMGRAKRFYENVIGLAPVGAEGGDDFAAYRSGGTKVWVYRSDYAGSNKATALSWEVGDVDGVVRELKGKGVAFEHYDMPGLHQEGDVHVSDDGRMRIAWFKDPDGNILSVANA